MAAYERVTINGIRAFVCANCRMPHYPGTKPPYHFPRPSGQPSPDLVKQSVCGKCYRESFAFMYPPSVYGTACQPNVADNILPDTEPIPWDMGLLEPHIRTEKDIWAEAFAIWQKDGMTGTPDAVFERLVEEERGKTGAEVTVTEVQLEVVRR